MPTLYVLNAHLTGILALCPSQLFLNDKGKILFLIAGVFKSLLNDSMKSDSPLTFESYASNLSCLLSLVLRCTSMIQYVLGHLHSRTSTCIGICRIKGFNAKGKHGQRGRSHWWRPGGNGPETRATGRISTRVWRGSAGTYVHGRLHSKRSRDTLGSFVRYQQSVACRCLHHLAHLHHTPETAEVIECTEEVRLGIAVCLTTSTVMVKLVRKCRSSGPILF